MATRLSNKRFIVWLKSRNVPFYLENPVNTWIHENPGAKEVSLAWMQKFDRFFSNEYKPVPLDRVVTLARKANKCPR